MMGFLQAVYKLAQKDSVSKSDLWSRLDLPGDPENGRVIRVGLKVSAFCAPYTVTGIGTIDVADLLAGDLSEEQWKTRYLFREPSSPSTGWRYTPIIKIGQPTTYEKFEESWQKFRKTLSEKTFPDFENSGVLAPGSTEIIIVALEERKQEIFSYMEKKRPHTLVFGIEENGIFHYPGDLQPFVDYCAHKLGNLSKPSSGGICSVCADPLTNVFHLDKIFSFATFDKPGFIPALNSNNKGGVFPICERCFDTFTRGRAILDRDFTDSDTLRGYNLWVIPEVLGGTTGEKITQRSFEDYFRSKKTSSEAQVLRYLTSLGENLVFHFVIWQKMQAKELLHLMVEDVSPSWLSTLENHWKAIRECLYPEETPAAKDDLKYMFSFIFFIFSEQSQKSDEDKSVLTKIAIEIVSRLLSRRSIDTLWLKSIFVSRFPSLFSGPGNPKFSLQKQLMFIEYVSIVNQYVNRITN